MRKKHENPLVIDIIDQHQVFKKQWYKRKKFYLSKNYTVKITNDYKKDIWSYLSKKEKNNELENPNDISFNKCMISL
jgi:hypothetical protein